MSGLWWVAAIALFLMLVLWSHFAPSLAKTVRRAVKTRDLQSVLGAIEKKRPTARPTAFNQAIRLLWDMDERRMALDLVKELAERHGDARIAQYWLREAMTTEPGIARRVFTRAFVAEHYRPEVAAQCGPAG
jgi:hypothetical protein